MKLREEQRDLFEVNKGLSGAEPYCYAHCISADFGMFGGIVVEFNKRWNMKNRLLNKYGSQVNNFMRIGSAVFPEEVTEYDHTTTVFNLVTKPIVSSRPTYWDLETSLVLMKEYMITSNLHKLAIPKLGCGIDGLSWDTVKDLIAVTFEKTDIEILVCFL